MDNTKPPEGSALKVKLSNDLKEALKAGEKTRLSVIRLVISAINNTEIARQAKLTDIDVVGVIAKEIKQRQESIEAYKQGSRPDLVAAEEAELSVLKTYMPEQMSREEVTATARRIISETGAHGPHDKGKVMPKIMAELKGKADGRMINEVVTELLAQS